MSYAPLIYLDIKEGGGPAGWTEVTANNGQTYAYQFTGGNDGHGNVEQPIGSPIDLFCVSIADARYQIQANSLTISNDPNNELTGVVNDVRSIRITDKNDIAESGAYWSLGVVDTDAGCTIPCDPRVTNDPNK